MAALVQDIKFSVGSIQFLEKLWGPLLGSLYEGFDYFGNVLGAPDCWKVPYHKHVLASDL